MLNLDSQQKLMISLTCQTLVCVCTQSAHTPTCAMLSGAARTVSAMLLATCSVPFFTLCGNGVLHERQMQYTCKVAAIACFYCAAECWSAQQPVNAWRMRSYSARPANCQPASQHTLPHSSVVFLTRLLILSFVSLGVA